MQSRRRSDSAFSRRTSRGLRTPGRAAIDGATRKSLRFPGVRPLRMICASASRKQAGFRSSRRVRPHRRRGGLNRRNHRLVPQPSPTSITFYVSVNDGDDDATGRSPYRNCPVKQCGSGDGPFATFKRAQRAVRELDKHEPANSHRPIRGGHLLPRGGKTLARPLESRSIAFDAADFGSAETKIIYGILLGAKPVISGGFARARLEALRKRTDGPLRPGKALSILRTCTSATSGACARVSPCRSGGGDRYPGSYLRIEDAVYVDNEVKDRCPKPAQAEGTAQRQISVSRPL